MMISKEADSVWEALSILRSMSRDNEELFDLTQAASESFARLLSDSGRHKEEKLLNKGNAWIETYTGKAFSFYDFSEKDFCLEDIAHALSHICRYNGHTKKFYSVAEHSCLLALFVYTTTPHDVGGLTLARTALLHDAAEAYVGDMTSPLKRLFPRFSDLEDKIYKVIARKFGALETIPQYIHKIDTQILLDERAACLSKSNNRWGNESDTPLKVSVSSLCPEVAETFFINLFSLLSK